MNPRAADGDAGRAQERRGAIVKAPPVVPDKLLEKDGDKWIRSRVLARFRTNNVDYVVIAGGRRDTPYLRICSASDVLSEIRLGTIRESRRKT